MFDIWTQICVWYCKIFFISVSPDFRTGQNERKGHTPLQQWMWFLWEPYTVHISHIISSLQVEQVRANCVQPAQVMAPFLVYCHSPWFAHISLSQSTSVCCHMASTVYHGKAYLSSIYYIHPCPYSLWVRGVLVPLSWPLRTFYFPAMIFWCFLASLSLQFPMEYVFQKLILKLLQILKS